MDPFEYSGKYEIDDLGGGHRLHHRLTYRKTLFFFGALFVLFAVVLRSTNRQSNTHSTEKQKVRYRWHPWCGQAVVIDETITKRGQTFVRCRVEAVTDGRALEIPQWMFERACDSIGVAGQPSGEAAIWISDREGESCA